MEELNEMTIHYNTIKTLNIATLQNMYSPMFDKTFDKMNDDEIKQQLDAWVESGEHAHLFEEQRKPTQDDNKRDFRRFIGGKRK